MPNSHRILVVEDDDVLRKTVERLLVKGNYTVSLAGDAEQARAILEKESVDLILLDWMLPELDGLEICSRLKSNPETHGIMILLVTARGSVANRVEGFNAGADEGDVAARLAIAFPFLEFAGLVALVGNPVEWLV